MGSVGHIAPGNPVVFRGCRWGWGRGESATLSHTHDPELDDLVFGTRTGRPDSRNNVRRRVLLRAVERANKKIAEASGEPLPEGLAPHALRRSFASWLVAEKEDPAYVMAQLGHTDAKMTLGLYAQALKSKSRRADRALSGAGGDLSVGEMSEAVSS